MKTIKYKTLRGLLGQCGQLNFNDFHARKFFHNKFGWCSFSLPECEMTKGYSILSSAVYFNGSKHAEKLRRYNGTRYGILNRFFFEGHGRSASYCAGQDYAAEIRTIQRIFRENR